MRDARTVTELVDDLHQLGLAEGDAVMVHASLRAVGKVERGAHGVIEAIDASIGTTGTWLMTLGALDEHAWVNERAEHLRAALLADADPFDALSTPADPDVGTLAEIMRTTLGTVVSDHPDGRFAARGHGAGALVADVPWDDYYGDGSPLHRLVEAGGKVLRLGSGLDTVTLIHYAEYLVPLEHKRRVRRHHLVASPTGPVVRVVSCLDDSDGIVDISGEDYFITLTRDYLASGAASIGRVGGATSELLDASDLVGFATAWMAEHLGTVAGDGQSGQSA